VKFYDFIEIFRLNSVVR